MYIKKIICACLMDTLIACSLFMLCPLRAHAETTENLFNVKFIVPGMTETIDIVQRETFPLGCPQFFILVLGKGLFGVSLKKDDLGGDVIFMVGTATSSAGTFPVGRIGLSKGMIDQIVEIGDTDTPYGFIWLYCGVLFSDKDPAYFYQLRFSLSQ